MNQMEEFVDERHKAWCIHCGGSIAQLATNRDHAPSKSLLLKPYPTNLPVVQVCTSCNGGFSQDEEYAVAFLGSVLSGSADPATQGNPAVAAILSRSPKLRERIERSKNEYRTIGGETRCIWTPETKRLNRVVVKNARGHAFFEFGEPMLEAPDHVWCWPVDAFKPHERLEFADADIGGAWPEVGSRMLTRAVTGQDLAGGWVVVQDSVYRYAVLQEDGLLVRSVLFEYLATEVRWSH